VAHCRLDSSPCGKHRILQRAGVGDRDSGHTDRDTWLSGLGSCSATTIRSRSARVCRNSTSTLRSIGGR
jgi:hypothetical protein